MPELPEVEAWRRQLDAERQASPDRAGRPCAHRDAEDVRPAALGARGRGLRRRAPAREAPALPDRRRRARADGAPDERGPAALHRPGEKSPKTPAFRLRFADGGELVLTEAGKKKRAGVWLLRPDALEAELAHLGPEADELDAESLAPILASDSRRLHSLLRDQRLIAGIGRAWANEILHAARLSPYALSTQLTDEEIERLATAIHDELARGLELRLAGRDNEQTYRVHNALGEPCSRCGTPLAQVDFEEHTIYYCPECQTEGRVLKDRRMSRLLR